VNSSFGKRSTVNTEPPGRAGSVRLPWWYWVGILAATGIVVWNLFAGPLGTPNQALVLVVWTYGILPALADPVVRILPRHWFRVSRRERILHRMLGVESFGWFLERSGYNRRIARPMRGFDGTRGGLHRLERSLRANAGAHSASFAIHLLLSLVALATGHTWGAALWILLPGVVVHVYPVLLQRSLMLRVQPMLAKLSFSNVLVR
jgi:hypothetical protein